MGCEVGGGVGVGGRGQWVIGAGWGGGGWLVRRQVVLKCGFEWSVNIIYVILTSLLPSFSLTTHAEW